MILAMKSRVAMYLFAIPAFLDVSQVANPDLEPTTRMPKVAAVHAGLQNPLPRVTFIPSFDSLGPSAPHKASFLPTLGS